MIEATSNKEEKKDRVIAYITTGVYIILIALLLILGGLKYLDPPPQTGLEVNLGYSETGQGNVEEEPQNSQTTPTPSDSEEQMTQDDSPVKTNKNEEKDKPKTPKEPEKPKTDDRLSKASKNAFKNKKQGGQGDDKQDGNKGSDDGSPTGNDGSSGGGGDGIDFSLKGRSALSLPKPTYQSNEQGVVVVDIIVDENGRVVSAKAYGRGSTTNDAALHAQAQRAAMKAKFSTNPDGPEKQKGTITYIFKLN